MESARFTNKVAVVTGGASGIGAATAHQLASEGARVVVADIDEGRATAVVNEICGRGFDATAIAVDLALPSSIQLLIEKTLAQYGRLDVLHNNATSGDMGRVAEISIEAWNRTLAINLTGHFLMMREALPLMVRQRSGAIVNMASVAALTAEAGLGAYSAAKAGLISLTRNVASEYARDGIRANVICPGAIETPPTQAFTRAVEGMRARMERANPMRRLGRAEEVAHLVCFLASDEASYITGATYVVDGGAFADNSVGLLGDS